MALHRAHSSSSTAAKPARHSRAQKDRRRLPRLPRPMAGDWEARAGAVGACRLVGLSACRLGHPAGPHQTRPGPSAHAPRPPAKFRTRSPAQHWPGQQASLPWRAAPQVLKKTDIQKFQQIQMLRVLLSRVCTQMEAQLHKLRLPQERGPVKPRSTHSWPGRGEQHALGTWSALLHLSLKPETTPLPPLQPAARSPARAVSSSKVRSCLRQVGGDLLLEQTANGKRQTANGKRHATRMPGRTGRAGLRACPFTTALISGVRLNTSASLT